MKHTKVLRCIEVELESGKKVSHQFVYKCHLDGDYGADIDGNRGMPMLFVELEDAVPRFTRDLQLKDSSDSLLSDEEFEEAIDLLWTSAGHEAQTIELEDDYDPRDYY